jgi:hypothetical protein
MTTDPVGPRACGRITAPLSEGEGDHACSTQSRVRHALDSTRQQSERREEIEVKRFLLLYNGPSTPPEASHQGWPQWFDRIGDALIDLGSPMVNGLALRGDGVRDDATSLNGFSIVQAVDRDASARPCLRSPVPAARK